jgi:hypothetical protein
LRYGSLSQLVARWPLSSSQEVASAEKPRNRLSKGNDLIEGAMM